MKIQKLMHAIGRGYPDGYTDEYFDFTFGVPKLGAGDGLARFIVQEVFETFDPDATDEAQIDEACRVLQVTIREVSDVLDAVALLAMLPAKRKRK